MTETHFDRVQELFEAAVALPDEMERDAFLRRASRGDEVLLAEVIEILDADAQTEAVLDAGVPGLPADAPADRESSIPEELEMGTVLSDYELTEKVGTGGFGSVYRARHTVIGKLAAIKVLHPEHAHSPALTQRFVNEARAVNEIGHPNIIDVFGFGRTTDGRDYSIMAFVDAPSLAEVLQAKPRWRWREALPILRGLAAALDAAHAHGIVHRDLKPANVLVQSQPDGSTRPILVDFGIAKLRGDTLGATHTTQAGQLMGTPAYMSPEQICGQVVDGKADAYALGVLAYRLLTGRLPFEAENAFEVLVQHTQQEATAPSLVVAEIPASIDDFVLSLLSKDPVKRPGSLTDAIDTLTARALTPPTAPSPPRSSRLPLFAGLTALAGGAALWALWPGPSEPTPSPAVPAAAVAPTTPGASTARPVPPSRRAGSTTRSVRLDIRGAPPDTRVLDADGNNLGLAPGVLVLPAKDTPAELRFVHAERGTLTVQVELDRDRTIELSWPTAPTKKPRRKLHQDLESPF